jgi:hypothetical protein
MWVQQCKILFLLSLTSTSANYTATTNYYYCGCLANRKKINAGKLLYELLKRKTGRAARKRNCRHQAMQNEQKKIYQNEGKGID